jgi:TPR repeat protein
MITALLLVGAAHAGQLPGIPIDFATDEEGRWALPEALPAGFAEAGVQPGWPLTAVEGHKLDDLEAIRAMVAAGPPRPVQLHFDTEEGETVVVVPRAPLVHVEDLGLLPWSAGFQAGETMWLDAADGFPLLRDATGNAWALDPATGAQTDVNAPDDAEPAAIPDVWWALSGRGWVLQRTGGLVETDAAGAREALAGAWRIRGFQGAAGDHLLVPGPDGLEVLSVTWPRDTPELPVCVPGLPESCLVSGRQVAATLAELPGGRAEAERHLGLACGGGVYRACLEAVALTDDKRAKDAEACVAQDANACHAIGRARMADVAEDADPDGVTMGILEYACSVDASGSLGERLRRLEDVGEGCMMLSGAFDTLGVADRALLTLDQACVLGRAAACEEATARRAEAFALKTVQECEAPSLPLASSCVQLGLLLQQRDISATTLDDFGAFLRACELGDEEGCVLLGDYVDRWGIAHPRVVKAESTLQSACDEGEQRACIGSAHLLVRHEPRTEAYGQALTQFAAACAAGLPAACIAGAEQRRIGQARKVEAPEPVGLWTSACDLDSAPGCAGLGERLSRSKKTWDETYTAWTKACDTGEASACTDLGRFVTNKHDPAWPGEQTPEAYLQQGCDNGDAEGCYWLAEADLPKKGDPPEPAYLLLEQSCDGGYGDACAELGEVHLDRKTSFDDEIAAGHMQAACDAGHFESCKELGTMYLRGKGVEKDRTRAKELAQRYSVNARRRHLRLGAHFGFPYVAGAEGELVLPIPVGPALSFTGSYSYLPTLGGIMEQLQGDSYPDVPGDLWYADAGVRLYPNNKGRGIYGMAGVHRIQAVGGELQQPITREGLSARLGMYNENKAFYTRVEMGIAQYGMVNLQDFDEDETGTFPLIQATLGVSMGLAVF